MRRWIAYKLRLWADRIDPHGAPRAINWYFTFERHKGLVFNSKGRGCQVWYYGLDNYQDAHLEAESSA